MPLIYFYFCSALVQKTLVSNICVFAKFRSMPFAYMKCALSAKLLQEITERGFELNLPFNYSVANNGLLSVKIEAVSITGTIMV